MTSKQHALWISRGRPWQVALPVATLGGLLMRYGYTVYFLGDTRHLDHIPPEDHTPYSETGWPIATEYGWVTACDIMPPTDAQRRAGLPSLQALGAQLFRDKQADDRGVKWIKYMNWGPVSDSSAVHDQWQPGHQRSSSGDTGHIHLSDRSDMIHYAGAAGYDPIARLRGEDNDMAREDVINIVNLLAAGTSMAGYADQDNEPLNDVASKVNLTILAGKLDTITNQVAALGEQVAKLGSGSASGAPVPPAALPAEVSVSGTLTLSPVAE